MLLCDFSLLYQATMTDNGINASNTAHVIHESVSFDQKMDSKSLHGHLYVRGERRRGTSEANIEGERRRRTSEANVGGERRRQKSEASVKGECWRQTLKANVKGKLCR